MRKRLRSPPLRTTPKLQLLTELLSLRTTLGPPEIIFCNWRYTEVTRRQVRGVETQSSYAHTSGQDSQAEGCSGRDMTPTEGLLEELGSSLTPGSPVQGSVPEGGDPRKAGFENQWGLYSGVPESYQKHRLCFLRAFLKFHIIPGPSTEAVVWKAPGTMWQKGNRYALLVGMFIGSAIVENSLEFPLKIKHR